MRNFICWLFNIQPNADSQLSLRFNQEPEGLLALMLGLIVIAFAVWIYWRDGKGTAPPLLRVFLGFLRAALIALAILILAEPVLLATNTEVRRSVVIVMVDDSYSMELKFADPDEGLRKLLQSAMREGKVAVVDPDGKSETLDPRTLEAAQFKRISRLNVVSAALGAPLKEGRNFLDELTQKHDLRFVTFSQTVTATGAGGKPPDPARLEPGVKGGETRIGDCLREAIKELRGQPLAGIVVISDGRQNAGEDAVQAAQACRAQRVPLFTVGIGDPSEPKDFDISVDGQDTVMVDDPTEFTVSVRYKGYTGINTVRVSMKDGDKEVSGEDVKLGKPGEKAVVSMHFKEAKPGKKVFKISIPEMPGEMRTENNAATYTVQVVDKKVKVLFVEGQDLPRWEYRYLKNALRRDHTSEVDVLLATSEGAFLWDGTDGKQPLEQFPTSKKEINDYDVLIFGDVNPGIFTTEQVNLVRDFVREGGGFIMIAGERYAPAEYGQGSWFEMLPVIPTHRLEAPLEGFQEAFPLELTAEGKKKAWTHLDAEEAVNREVWENLPKLYWYFPIKRKKDLATTIAVHPFDKDEAGGKMPLIVTMPYGSGQSMFIGVDSLWRWRRAVGDRYHYRFYNQAIRHLSTAKRLGGQKRFFLGSDRNVAAIGDKVVLTAVVRDADLKEIKDPLVRVHGKNSKGEDVFVDLHKLHDRPGHYEADVYPTMQGEWTYWLREESQPENHLSEIALKIEKPQLEFDNPRMDKQLLMNIADAGAPGGGYFEIDRLVDIPPRIAPLKLEIPRETPYPLWDKWLVFVVFTVLITLEWVLRKKGRMI